MSKKHSELLEEIKNLQKKSRQLNYQLETLYQTQKAEKVTNGYEKWRYEKEGGLKLVKEQFKILNYKCPICLDSLSETSATIDHLLPKSKYLGQAMRINNMLIMCHSCNACKKDKEFKDWYNNLPKPWQLRVKKALENIHGITKIHQLLNH